jgi:tetratricopeptide (TPR) repeat protein
LWSRSSTGSTLNPPKRPFSPDEHTLLVTTRARHIIFSFLPVTALLLVIVLAEIGLRIFSPRQQAALADTVPFDGITWYQTNRAFLRKYFPGNTPLVPEFKTTLFRKEKTQNTFRIMCLGESSMFGTPYDMNANIPGLVRKQLRRLYPGKEIEVINWGASAINTNVIRDLAPGLLVYQPDLVLVYTGHNEFYGPDGVGASFLERRVSWMTRLKYAARQLRLMQLLEERPGGSGGERQKGEAPNLMRQVSQGSLVALDSDETYRVVMMFEDNLRAILQTFAEARVPVVLSEVSSNLMFPPFVSDSLGPADRSAVLEFKRGLALRAAGRFTEARTALLRAKDLDLLKFRAPEAINAVIRQVAEETHTPLVRADSIFATLSPDGIPGDSLFWEHLHPTALGYYHIAAAFTRTLVSGRLIPGDVATDTLLPFQPDSLGICWLDLAYADYSIGHLTGRWPFHEFHRVPAVLHDADATLRHIVEETHARRLRWNEACYATASYFWRVGRMRDALTTYEAMLDEYPFSYYTNYLAGSLLNTVGQPERAMEYYRRSVASNGAYERSRLDLGLLEVNAGNPDEAIRQLNQVLALTGSGGDVQVRANAYYGLAAACANRGEMDLAERNVDEALRLMPDYRDARQLRDRLRLAGRGDF